MKPQIWNQLKNKTAGEFISGLERDGWTKHKSSGGSRRVYIKGQKLVSIHFHPQKNYARDMIMDLLNDIGWTEADLKRLKLIK